MSAHAQYQFDNALPTRGLAEAKVPQECGLSTRKRSLNPVRSINCPWGDSSRSTSSGEMLRPPSVIFHGEIMPYLWKLINHWPIWWHFQSFFHEYRNVVSTISQWIASSLSLTAFRRWTRTLLCRRRWVHVLLLSILVTFGSVRVFAAHSEGIQSGLTINTTTNSVHRVMPETRTKCLTTWANCSPRNSIVDINRCFLENNIKEYLSVT